MNLWKTIGEQPLNSEGPAQGNARKWQRAITEELPSESESPASFAAKSHQALMSEMLAG